MSLSLNSIFEKIIAGLFVSLILYIVNYIRLIVKRKKEKECIFDKLQKSHRRLIDTNIIEISPEDPGIIILGLDQRDSATNLKFLPTNLVITDNINKTISYIKSDINNSQIDYIVLKFEVIQSYKKRKKRFKKLIKLLSLEKDKDINLNVVLVNQEYAKI